MSESNPNSRQPRHVAVIMDGNGRWARQRRRPRFSGHQAGLEAVRRTVKACINHEIEVLTVFAFSSENWRRPPEEVRLLMGLFMTALDREVSRLHKNGVRLRIIGDRSAFGEELTARIDKAESLTRDNTRLTLVVAVNYGGRWDIAQAARAAARDVANGTIQPDDVDADTLAGHLSVHDLPEPDLFIRTGGEKRISNFLLWHLAYTELYFTDMLWPDFDEDAFGEALRSFASRQRRFGRTGEQVEQSDA